VTRTAACLACLVAAVIAGSLPACSSSSAHGGSGSPPVWLLVVIGAFVLFAVIAQVVLWLGRRPGVEAVEGGWYLRLIDAYSKGSALHDAMSAAEEPARLAAQSPADELAQTLYELRQSAPDPESRARVDDALQSLQAVRSAISRQTASGAGAAQAGSVRGLLFQFQASLQALRVPGHNLPY
jgi:hypothetical protein